MVKRLFYAGRTPLQNKSASIGDSKFQFRIIRQLKQANEKGGSLPRDSTTIAAICCYETAHCHHDGGRAIRPVTIYRNYYHYF